MSNFSAFILRFLGLSLFVALSATNKDLSQILWSQKNISTPAQLNTYLKSNFGMAREWIRMSDDKKHLVMGKEGTFKLTDCLETMRKDRKPFQEITLMVIWKADYDMAVKELESVKGAIKFVILSLRLWTGANGDPPKIKPVEMGSTETYRDGTRKSFGPGFPERNVTDGFSRELIGNMTVDFSMNNFSLNPNLILSFSVFEIALTPKELLKPLAKLMGRVQRLELTGYSANPPKHLDMDYFMDFVKAHLKLEECYLDVQPDIREIIKPSLATTTPSTDTTPIPTITNPSPDYTEDDSDLDTVPTEPNAGGRVRQAEAAGIMLIGAMVLGLL